MTAAGGGGIGRGAILAIGAAVCTLLVIGAALLAHDLLSARHRTPNELVPSAESPATAQDGSVPNVPAQAGHDPAAQPPAGAPADPHAAGRATSKATQDSERPSEATTPESRASARRVDKTGVSQSQLAASSKTAGPGTAAQTPSLSPSRATVNLAGGKDGMHAAAPTTGATAAAATPVQNSARPAADGANPHANAPAETPPATHPHEDTPQEDKPNETTEEAENDPDSDRRPPTLDGLRFDPPEINDGGMATLYVQASDDLSGPGSVTGVISSPSGTAMLPFRVDASNAPETVFAVKIAIPAKAETGIWYVSNLVVYDRVQNPLIQRFTPQTVPPGGSIRVTSAESDSTPPQIVSMSIERASMSGGEKNRVRVDVTDDRSGVASVRGTFQSPSKAALVPFLCQATGDPNVWQGEFLLPPGAECGAWTVQSVRPADVAGNSTVVQEGSPQVAGAGFSVTGGDCDQAGPTLTRVMLSPDSVSNDTVAEVNVTIELEDPNGKADSITGWVRGPASTTGQPPMLLFQCRHAGNEPSAPWTGTITLQEHSAKGTWTVAMIRVRDKAMAQRDYSANDPVLAGATFTVR